MQGNAGWLSQKLSPAWDKITEQVWYQQLKDKWEELDPQSRLYLRIAGAGIISFAVLTFAISSLWQVHTLKKDLADRTELIQLVQTAGEELRRLRESNPGAGGHAGENENWTAFFETTAQMANLDKAALTIGPEKALNSSDSVKESGFEITLKHVNLKQVVNFAFKIENSGKPIKLRNMTVDTKSDPSGYLDATFSVSAFSLKQQ